MVNNIPVGAVLSDGSQSFTATAVSTSVDIKGWILSSLTITPPHDSDGDFTLSITATSQDGVGGPTASTNANLTVTVNAVADELDILTSSASGTANDAAIALDISVALTDLDGSELVQSIEIQGVPDSYLLSAGTALEDGGWLLTLADLPGLALDSGEPVRRRIRRFPPADYGDVDRWFRHRNDVGEHVRVDRGAGQRAERPRHRRVYRGRDGVRGCRRRRCA